MTFRITRCLAGLLLFLALCTCAHAEVHLPQVLADHAVLQRDRPVHLWGTATPQARLTLRFHQQTAFAQADALGNWSAFLRPEAAGGPFTLTITGDGAPKQLSDLLVGDVWFASGQSNMEMPLAGFPPGASVKDADKEIAAASNPKLRLLVVDHRSSDIPLRDIKGSWTTCTPETAKHFSAVAYFFGRELAAREKVPIGLIDSSWGGTPADSWVSLDTLGTNAQLLPAFASRARFAEQQADHDAQIAADARAQADARAAGEPVQYPYRPEETSWLPAGLYDGMIAPFAPMSIRGFLWYQGETNSSPERAPYYNTLFSALIADWRSHFNQGDLPFLFAQISSYDSPAERWGMVRDGQRRTLATANTAMAVTLDVGLATNVHPPDKQTVAARLALDARALSYHEAVAFQGPLYREASTETQPDGSASMRVWFDHAEALTSHAHPISGFELAGSDHHFVPAQASIDGASVLVHAASLLNPRFVRFGWNNVVTASLYNAAGLPASTFTSEQTPTP